MTVLMVAIGSHGDVLPFVAIGAELVRRGHRVELASLPAFAGCAERAGLRFVPLAPDGPDGAWPPPPELWHPRKGAAVALRFAAAYTAPVHRWLAEAWAPNGVVVASPYSLGARVAQDRLGCPLLTTHVMPVLVESRAEPPIVPGIGLGRRIPPRLRRLLARGADRYVIDPVARPPLNRFRAELGLPPMGRLRHWWDSPDRLLLFPDWYAPRSPDWPDRTVQVSFPIADGYGDRADLPAELKRFLAAGAPPLAFTYGSAMSDGRGFFAEAAALCRRSGRRGVLVAPGPGQVPDELPDGVVATGYVPFGALLPGCAALVHHGGIGTVALALAAGIPQLIVPVAFDHFDNADRLGRLQVGASLARGRFTAARAAPILDALLASPAVAARCATLAARMSGQDGARGAADTVEGLLRRATRPGPGQAIA